MSGYKTDIHSLLHSYTPETSDWKTYSQRILTSNVTWLGISLTKDIQSCDVQNDETLRDIKEDLSK